MRSAIYPVVWKVSIPAQNMRTKKNSPKIEAILKSIASNYWRRDFLAA